MHVSSILKRTIRWGIVVSASLAILQAHADLFVTSQSGPARGVLRYHQADGSFAGIFAPLGANADPLGMAFGPDGNLYVADGTENKVLRYDGRTGAYLGVFASGVAAPINLVFGPDGNLYVSSSYSQVVRFNGRTGAPMGTFVSDTRLAYPRGLTFGPDGNLYVVSYNTASVLRYSPTGTFLNAFVAPGSGGLFTPDDLLFGPDGNLYVTGGTFPNAGVMRYNGTTGTFLGQFASAGPNNAPIDMAYGPDGNLYVTVGGAENAVLRFNGQTGALIDHFVTSGGGGLQNPFGIAFSPVPEPSTVALLAVATGFMLARRRR